MAIKSLQATVAAWQAGTGTGQQRYLDGVANTDVDVAGRAVASQQALVNNFNARVQDGTWARRLQAACPGSVLHASVEVVDECLLRCDSPPRNVHVGVGDTVQVALLAGAGSCLPRRN